jgi:hypothetical protein
MSNDIRSLLEKLSLLEAKITPVNVKHGLNKQQQSVPQLPALFKPKNISPVLGKKKDPRHPAAGYMVGADESVEPRGSLAETMSDIEEDMLNKVKRDFVDYLDSLKKGKHSDELKSRDQKDTDLKDRDHDDRSFRARDAEVTETDQDTATGPYSATLSTPDGATPPHPADSEVGHEIDDKIASDLTAANSPVKTVAMEDGSVFEIHGDEDLGFSIRRGERELPTKFRNIDHADLAIKLFQKRQQQRQLDQDYVEEK